MRGRAMHQPVATRQYGTPCWFTRAERFSPASVAGLVLWLAADDAASLFQSSGLDTPALVDGDPVGGWKNRGAGAYHALQGTADRRPLLRLNGVNGLPLVEFDGSDDYLAVTRMTGKFSDGLSYFMVLKFADGRPPGTRRPFGARTSFPIQSYFTATLPSSGSMVHATWIDAEYYEAPLLSLDDGETEWHLLATVMTRGGDLTSYVDGIETATVDMSASTWSSIASPVSESPFLGAENLVGSPTGAHSLRLAELLIYGTPLGGADREAIEQYLQTKYGLS
ncbi:MAG: hypothetical protein KF708_02545 [Pirellulales bacterium]|nr:hypothetical protein [Pirellulales bacterium]